MQIHHDITPTIKEECFATVEHAARSTRNEWHKYLEVHGPFPSLEAAQAELGTGENVTFYENFEALVETLENSDLSLQIISGQRRFQVMLETALQRKL